ncbi:hypothetical protein VULLAG_LOCUS20137 [Vulpes lagopus]
MHEKKKQQRQNPEQMHQTNHEMPLDKPEKESIKYMVWALTEGSNGDLVEAGISSGLAEISEGRRSEIYQGLEAVRGGRG